MNNTNGNGHAKNTYTTGRGITVTFNSIAPLLEKLLEWQSATAPKEPAADATPEQRAEYETAVRAHQRDYNIRLGRLILLRGLQVALPTDDAWEREQELIGMEIPTDPLLRRLHWLETELTATQEDSMQLIVGVLTASASTPEMVQSARALLQQETDAPKVTTENA